MSPVVCRSFACPHSFGTPRGRGSLFAVASSTSDRAVIHIPGPGRRPGPPCLRSSQLRILSISGSSTDPTLCFPSPIQHQQHRPRCPRRFWAPICAARTAKAKGCAAVYGGQTRVLHAMQPPSVVGWGAPSLHWWEACAAQRLHVIWIEATQQAVWLHCSLASRQGLPPCPCLHLSSVFGWLAGSILTIPFSCVCSSSSAKCRQPRGRKEIWRVQEITV